MQNFPGEYTGTKGNLASWEWPKKHWETVTFIWMTKYSHLRINYNRLEVQLSGGEDPGSIFNTTKNEESGLIYFLCDNHHKLIIIEAQWLIHGNCYNHHFPFVCVWNFPLIKRKKSRRNNKAIHNLSPTIESWGREEESGGGRKSQLQACIIEEKLCFSQQMRMAMQWGHINKAKCYVAFKNDYFGLVAKWKSAVEC